MTNEQTPDAPTPDSGTPSSPESRTARSRTPRRDSCPECGGTLIAHEGDANPYKVGAKHCNNCGGCFIDGKRR